MASPDVLQGDMLRKHSLQSMGPRASSNRANDPNYTAFRSSSTPQADVSRHARLSRQSGNTFEAVSVSSVRTGNQPARIKSLAVLPTSAADKFIGHAATSSSVMRRQQQLPPYIIHPMATWYRVWWYTTVGVAFVTAWLIPFLIAFTDQVGLWPYGSAGSIIQYVLTAMILADICITFFVARYVEGELVTDKRTLAKNYLKLYFWIDLVSIIPFETILAVSMGYTYGPSNVTTQYINLLKLTYMLRCYRIHWFFSYLTYNLKISLVAITFSKNAWLVIETCHGFACGFYFIARQYNFGEWTWVGQAATWLEGASRQNTFDMYVYSLYWALVTFASVGYGDFHAWNVIEAVWTIIFIVVSVFLLAYVIGSTTLAIIKGDERVGKYRERMHALLAYARLNKLDGEAQADLYESMQSHVKLHFNNEQASDEAVLASFPSTIRRRVLRYLYLEDLQTAYIFQGCKQRFLDALLAKAKVELYLPGVEVLTEDEFVAELFVVVSGELEKYSATKPFMTEDLHMDRERSVHGAGLLGTKAMYEEGDVLGEIAFITGRPQLETFRTRTACRLLAISRTAYHEIAEMFPVSALTVLRNIQQRVEEVAEMEFSGLRGAEVYQQVCASDPQQLQFKWASEEALAQQEKLTDHDTGLPPMTTRQEKVVGDRVALHHVLSAFVTKYEEDRTLAFLTAASHGNTEFILQQIMEGVPVNSHDYDGRTALMLACVKGFTETVQLLLDADADPNMVDNFGGTALWEACKHRHLDCIQLLVDKRASLKREDEASLLCQCVYSCDLDLLKCLLLAGCNVDAGDYDARTALHVSAAEGNLPAVRMLLDAGASVVVKDRWDHTPLDEAKRVGAKLVSDELQAALAGVRKAPKLQKLANSKRDHAKVLGALVPGDSVPEVTNRQQAEGLMQEPGSDGSISSGASKAGADACAL